jgi:acetate kinase
MLGMSGVSPDMRDIERAAAEGNARRELAIDAFVERFATTSALPRCLGGCDVLAFTGGIGENGVAIREAICRNLAGPESSWTRTRTTCADRKRRSARWSRTRDIWIIPTNEELIVADKRLRC